jgi:hypothetical protein
MTTTETTTTIIAFLSGIGVGVTAMATAAWLVRRCRIRAFRRQFLQDVQNSRVTVLDPGTWPWSTTRQPTPPPPTVALGVDKPLPRPSGRCKAPTDRDHPTGPAA